MKAFWISLAAVSLVFSQVTHAAQTAQARLYCESLKVYQGTAGFGDTLDLSSIASPLNGELYPAGGSDYASGIVVFLSFFGFPMSGSMNVQLPPFTDANGNGFDDFFEVSQAVVSADSSGTFVAGGGGLSGTVTALWNRSAGSKDGTVVFTLDDDTFGILGNFTHTFEVLEYTGPLTYTPGTTTVSGSVNLTQTGNPSATLKGPIQFQKSLSDPFDELTLQAGGWTNAASQTLTFDLDTFFRDLALDTNYFGFVFFDDGDPSTVGMDYPLWTLSIDDANDSDNDDIPDFSDNPAPPRQPVLTLTKTTTNLLLKISGDVGKLHHILSRTNLTAGTGWQTNLSVTLTNDPQTVSLPLPTTATRFWRALVP